VGLLHDIVFVIKSGERRYAKASKREDAERLITSLRGVADNLHIEEEQEERK
jgi:hypothetical protein